MTLTHRVQHCQPLFFRSPDHLFIRRIAVESALEEGSDAACVGLMLMDKVERDKQAKSLGWLVFSMHPLRLEVNQTIQAGGQLLDGDSYAFDITVLRVDMQTVTFCYAGRIGERDVQHQEMTVPLVPTRPIQLNVPSSFQKAVVPSLYVAWEPSVEVAPGETAVLIIGQRLEDEAEGM